PVATTVGWDAIVEADETDDSFLLFYNKHCAYYLPKRAVGGAASEHELRELLRRNLADRARGLRA
ncbi:MAG TPA: YcxB family protein, partial [Longimicrobium sp.]